MTADDVRARFEASVIRRYGNAPSWIFDKDEHGFYTSEAMQTEWNGYRAAHADLSGEVRELVEAATEIADNTENWNRAVIEIIGRQPNTGIGTERLRAALAKFTQEKP